MMRARASFGLAATLLVCLAVTASHAAPPHPKRIMPWLCLQRCGRNESQITASLQQLKDNSDIFDFAAAFEMYNLGANGTLVRDKLAHVAANVSSFGLQPVAMVSSYPYPPQFLDWMRTVFATPQPFIDSLISEARTLGLAGYNIDWEPTNSGNVTKQDAQDYATFLNNAGDQLAAAGLRLSATIASWSPIWNYTALAETSVSTLNDMSTYTGDWTVWQKELATVTSIVPLGQLGIGLETMNPNTKAPFTLAEMEQRFTALTKADVLEIDIWDAPVPANWLPLLRKWKSG
eukprot:PLAT6263.1.p2 GENE.PLAT6263.1~~PLAT6263.1.p2  ORF type:complete len:301 (+),score=116.58 PLAT6263.1:34-903(+)